MIIKRYCIQPLPEDQPKPDHWSSNLKTDARGSKPKLEGWGPVSYLNQQLEFICIFMEDFRSNGRVSIVKYAKILSVLYVFNLKLMDLNKNFGINCDRTIEYLKVLLKHT